MPREARTLFIGDVHGCSEELDALLALCAHRPGDRVVLVGDLVAKGPDSAGVVRRARALGALAVIGNHDLRALQWRRGQRSPGDRLRAEHQQVVETLGPEDWRYLERLPYFLRLPELGTIVVHGGLVPGVPLERQAEEHLVNLRSIRPDGTPSTRVEDGAPWASLWTGPETVIFGHDAVRGLQRHPFALGLDTGCVYGRELTAWELPAGRLHAVAARRVYKDIGAG